MLSGDVELDNGDETNVSGVPIEYKVPDQLIEHWN